MKNLFSFILSLGIVASIGAQVVSTNGGSISGDITDPSGAKVPSATVTVSSTETGFSKTIQTDSAGFYSVGPLNPGPYKVHVSAPGFEALDVSEVIRVGTATSGTFKLTLGSSKETVEVVAGSVQIDTDQPGVSDVLTREQIQSLPVNGRNFLDLAQIEPGVILQPGSTFDPTKAGYSAISVSGVSGRTTRILLDGQDITDETVGTTILNVSEGAIGEFQLNRSTQDASGEVTSTGEVLVSTQSGTNRFHGAGFYNFQDTRALFADANVIAVNTSTGAPLINPYYQRDQFGGSLGGPIIPNKLFFFSNIERIKQASQTPSNLGSVFSTINSQYPYITTPYKLTYSTGRLDYNGPLGGHYFFRAAYNVDGADRNPTFYELYTNRDNTYGFAGGADFQSGHFTHSFRGSYEKFHNFIKDHTQGNSSVYDPIAGFTESYSGQIAFGPNSNVPQATYQSDKQFRYDGSWTVRNHIVRFGYSINRILGGGFFAAYASSPSDTISSSTQEAGTVSSFNPNGYGCNNVVGAAPCLGDPLNGYVTSSLRLGNGLGGENEFPAFGLNNGGQFDWREAAYIQDSWKVTPNFTASAGLRWSVDTGRANQDLAPIPCSAIDQSTVTLSGTLSVPEVGYPTGCATPSTPIFSLFNPSFTGKVNQPYANFAPQAGITYSWGNHKTVLRAAGGFFYEGDVFNNASNARNNLLKQALGYGSLTTACSSYSLNFPDGSVVTTSPNGTSLKTLCQESVSAAAPQFIALQSQYQANQAAHLGTNGGFIGENLTISGQYAPNYKTPYGEQYNFGIQRELTKGAILSVDYVHNSTLRIAQSIDINHVGAARTFNQTAAATAIANTLAITCKGAPSVQAAITPGGCSGGSGGTTGAKYATISDFAKMGLDSATTFLGGNPASYAKKTAVAGVGPLEQAAFPGLNAQLGTGSFVEPIGRSGYDALQIVFKQQKAHPLPGIINSNFQVSYSLSRIVATTTSSDEFFDTGVIDKDNPSAFIGRSALDHKHEVSFGGSATFKYGVKMGIIGHFFTASPTTLTLDTASLTNGQIFQTDVTGDGTTGDVAPGTAVGAYSHSIKPENLGAYITNFNQTKAGTLTPAGQAVANSGLITQAQLIQMGAAIQPISQISNVNGQTRGVSNPTFRQMDAQISYPVNLHRLREGMTLEPVIAFYNVGNFANFANNTGTLQNTTTATCATVSQSSAYVLNPYVPSPTGAYNTCSSGGGYITGTNTLYTQASKRTVRNIGTFAQGAQRTTEFQLKLNF